METNEKCNTKEKEQFNIENINFFKIGGDIYIQINEGKKSNLLKYNDKYEKWVKIQFLEDTFMNAENKIVETLSSQYIERLIRRR